MAVHQTVIFVLVVIIACNAVLYPSLFSTIFRVWFGYPAEKDEQESQPEYPPHLRGRLPPGSQRPQFTGGDPQAYMARQRQEGSGHGMMGTILPVYAIGIVIYFGYVIYKIFLKEKPASGQNTWGPEEDPNIYGPTLERQQQEHLQRQLAAELRAANYDGMGGRRRNNKAGDQSSKPTEEEEEEEEEPSTPSPRTPKADADEVDLLKKRLEQTEKTMDKMMEMMNNMGVAFSRVTGQLNINADEPAKQQARQSLIEEDEEGDDESSDEGDIDGASWSEDSELLEGERVVNGDREDLEGDSRVEDIEDGPVRRRKVAVDDDDDED